MKNYFYVDEAGDLLSCTGSSELFLIGCIITEHPKELAEKIEGLKKEISDKAIYFRHNKQLNESGFHAAENHPDIYTRFVELLISLDFRAYIILIRKNNPEYLNYFNGKTGKEIYDNCLQLLLRDRLLKRKNNWNIITVEQNLPRQTQGALLVRKREIMGIVESINSELKRDGLITKKILTKIELKTKSEKLFSIVDYINHIILHAYSSNPRPGQKENFQLLKPKIGVVYDILNKDFCAPRKSH